MGRSRASPIRKGRQRPYRSAAVRLATLMVEMNTTASPLKRSAVMPRCGSSENFHHHAGLDVGRSRERRGGQILPRDGGGARLLDRRRAARDGIGGRHAAGERRGERGVGLGRKGQCEIVLRNPVGGVGGPHRPEPDRARRLRGRALLAARAGRRGGPGRCGSELHAFFRPRGHGGRRVPVAALADHIVGGGGRRRLEQGSRLALGRGELERRRGCRRARRGRLGDPDGRARGRQRHRLRGPRLRGLVRLGLGTRRRFGAGRRRRLAVVFVVLRAEQRGQQITLRPRPHIDAGRARGLDRHLRRLGSALLDIRQRDRIAGQRLAVGRDVHRAAVGEDACELVVAHARPVPHAADVEMDEGGAGGRVVADAAALQPEAGLALGFERYAGDEEVHGAAERVLAELGHPAAAPPQHRVGLGRAIAADHLDRALGIELAGYFPHHVDQARVHPGLFAAAPVAQQPIEFFERGLVVAAVALVGDRQVFAGVDMVQRDRARIAFGDSVLQTFIAQQQRQRGEADAPPRTRRAGAGQRAARSA